MGNLKNRDLQGNNRSQSAIANNRNQEKTRCYACVCSNFEVLYVWREQNFAAYVYSYLMFNNVFSILTFYILKK